MKKIGIYVRVSTNKQEVQNQLTALREYCKRKEYEIYNENYGTRNEVSPYIKTNIKVSQFNFYGDVQYRFSTFGYHDITGDFDLEIQDLNFLNWSIG